MLTDATPKITAFLDTLVDTEWHAEAVEMAKRRLASGETEAQVLRALDINFTSDGR